VRCAGGGIPDAQGFVVGEVGGFQHPDDPSGAGRWQWRIPSKKGGTRAWYRVEPTMNIARYKFPIVVAASLHGALFLVMPPAAAPDVPIPDEPVTLREIPLIEPMPVDVEPAADQDTTTPAAGAKPPPGIPDVLSLNDREPVFTVSISPSASTLDPVKTLANYTGLQTGPGVGPGDLTSVGIPGVALLDRVPRAMVQPSPDYPQSLRNEGTGGNVTVEFVVDTNGRVVSAEAVKWTRREFVDPAVRAVLRWRFEPGTQDGRKVRFRMAVPIEFNAER
jgi:protein TonB